LTALRSKLTQAARGIEYLHTQDPVVVHGNIKASNIFVADTGEACIGDFALSRKFDENANDSVSTPGRTAGEVRWGATKFLLVETLEEAQKTTRSDIFAFGRVIVELYTGKVHFANIPGMRFPPLVTTSTPLPTRPTGERVVARGLDDRVWQLVEDCCQVDPSARPSATDVVSRLQDIMLSNATGQAFEVPHSIP